MAKECSFDVVSEFDQQELVNALDQVRRELSTRFDLKDSASEVELEENKAIVITSSDEFKVQNIYDILESKVVKRGLSVFILDRGKTEEALGGRYKVRIQLKKGIDKDLAKKIVARIKETKLKVQPSIQGEQVRVSGKDKDELQSVIQVLRDEGERWSVPLQFTNYR